MDRRSRFVGINEHLRWLGRRTFWKPLEKSIPAKVHVTSVSVQFICMGIARDGDGCSSVSILSGPAVPSACCLVFPWTEATRSHAQALQWKLPSWWTYECFQVCTKNEPSRIAFRIRPVALKKSRWVLQVCWIDSFNDRLIVFLITLISKKKYVYISIVRNSKRFQKSRKLFLNIFFLFRAVVRLSFVLEEHIKVSILNTTDALNFVYIYLPSL